MYDVKLLIGGKERPAQGGATFERRNPVSGSVVSKAAAATTEDAVAAVAAAQAAFPAWSAQGPGARRDRLHRRLGPLQRAFRGVDVARSGLHDHAGFRGGGPLGRAGQSRHGT